MRYTMLKGKIHRATVTEANVDYVGSITIDIRLMKAAGIMEYEKVQVVDIDNANRFETYTIAGKENSGVICLNGAAAKLVAPGHKIIIMSYVEMEKEEIASHKPLVVFVNNKNRPTKITSYKEFGELT